MAMKATQDDLLTDLTEAAIIDLKAGKTVKIEGIRMGLNDNGNVVVANGLSVIAQIAWSETKRFFMWMWNLLKKLSTIIVNFFQKLMNALSGNGFVLTHKDTDGTIMVESVEQRAARKDKHHNAAQEAAIVKADS